MKISIFIAIYVVIGLFISLGSWKLCFNTLDRENGKWGYFICYLIIVLLWPLGILYGNYLLIKKNNKKDGDA